MRVSSKHRELLIHILVWMVWFLVPVLFTLGEVKQRNFFYQSWIPMAVSAILFYINYLFIVEKFLFKKRFVMFFLINIGAIVLGIFFAELLKQVIPLAQNISTGRPKPPRHFIYTGMAFSFVFIISISVAIRTTERWLKLDSQQKILENENLRSELSNLKMQLNPHFFFNTLNNIYSLIQISPPQAMEAVHGLAKLMRYHLYETNAEKVPVKGEVEFMKSYISLMELRTTKNVAIEQEFKFEDGDDLVAPLLFIPLLENAFKHGVSGDFPSHIKIHFEEKQHVLSLIVENSIIPEANKQIETTGIGLDNLKKRLQLIYYNKHIFESSVTENLFRVKLVILLA